MTDAELQGAAAQALNLAKKDLERNRLNFLLASYHVGDTPPLHRMRKIEALIIEKLGPNWLDNAKTKDAGFYVLRMATHLLPPDAFIFVTAANVFRETDKFKALPVPQQKEIAFGGHDRHHQAVKEGLMSIRDCLCAVAQTPTRVCHCVQEFHDGYPVGQPEISMFPQENFDGRLKMFGGD